MYKTDLKIIVFGHWINLKILKFNISDDVFLVFCIDVCLVFYKYLIVLSKKSVNFTIFNFLHFNCVVKCVTIYYP